MTQPKYGYYDKFCENPDCPQPEEPLGMFPYVGLEGRLYCDPLCAFVYESEVDILANID